LRLVPTALEVIFEADPAMLQLDLDALTDATDPGSGRFDERAPPRALEIMLAICALDSHQTVK